MESPEKPLPSDCCGTGCPQCVYDLYVEALRAYQAWEKQAAERSMSQNELKTETVVP